MNRGLRPVFDAINMDGCPICGEQTVGVRVEGPQDIRLACCHGVDVKEWADERYE